MFILLYSVPSLLPNRYDEGESSMEEYMNISWVTAKDGKASLVEKKRMRCLDVMVVVLNRRVGDGAVY